MGLTKLTGSQRPIGRLFPDRERRMIFLGTIQLATAIGTIGAYALRPAATFHPLLRARMAGRAQRLPVVGVPEQRQVAAVRAWEEAGFDRIAIHQV